MKPNEINTIHCEKIGTILADIHMIDFTQLGIVNDWSDNLQLTDWNFYLQKGQENNTVWVNLLTKIIDWESAGYINPMQELTETAFYLSENEIGNIDKERFLAFICGYKKRYGTLQANWRMVLVSGFLGKLDWLEYNLKRSLCIECTDEEEQQMWTAQVTGTINEIRRYADKISELEKWLNNEE